MTFRVLIIGPCTSVLTCVAISLSLSACVNGIPPPDDWTPPRVKPCQVVVIVDDTRACMTRWEFAEWRRVNSL